MHCKHCNHQNPVENFFCGHCGAPLLRPSAPDERSEEENAIGFEDACVSSPQPAPANSLIGASPADSPQGRLETEPAPPCSPLGGPSFLGLNASPEATVDSFTYLYDPEAHRGHGRWLVVLLVLAVLGGLVVYREKRASGWYLAVRDSVLRVLDPSAAQVPAGLASHLPSGVPNNVAVAQDSQPPARSAADTHSPGPLMQTAAPAPTKELDRQTSAEAAKDSPPAPNSESPDKSSVARRASEEERQPVGASQPVKESAVKEKEKNAGDDLLARAQAYLYGSSRNCGQALAYLNEAARRGNAKADSQFGTLYATGHCVSQNRAIAYDYFTRAVNAEHGRNVSIEHNREMLWREMTSTERAQVSRASLP